MNEAPQKPILGKVRLVGEMLCETGLHIGAQGAGGEIGGLDKPVIRDPLTNQPYVPGTSLKGKLRSLLERSLNLPFNHKGSRDTFRHECTNRTCEVCRLMGSAGKGEGGKVMPIPSRLIVRDMRLTVESLQALSEIETGLLYTEWKFENGLDRITSAANPRQMERVPAGARFTFELLYTVETDDAAQVAEDLTNLLNALKLLEDDTLGGSGSRGYGKVRFAAVKIEGRSRAFYRGDESAIRQLDGADSTWPQQMAAYFGQ